MPTRRTSLGDWLVSLVHARAEAPQANFMSALVEHMADAVAACDAEGNIVLLNRRAREGSEEFPAEVVVPPRLPRERWSDFFQLYPPDGTELLATEELPLVRALNGETVRDMRLETQFGNGTRAQINVSGGPVLGENEEVLGAVVVIQDATER